jgi:ADP-heptose:LPS heptosyltransferase
MDRAPQTILVYVGGDLVGDAVMKLPFIRALRHAWPEARITWCAGKYKSAFATELAPLMAGLIDEVIEEAGFDRPLSLLFRRPLNGRHFDLVIDTQRGVPATLLLHRVRHGLIVSGAADFYLSGAKPPKGYQRPAAMVRQMLDLLEIASGEPAQPNAPLLIGKDTQGRAERALPSGPIYVGLAPGAGGRQKCWPLENYIAIAKQQAQRNRKPVFVLGPGEADWVARLRDAVPEALFPTLDEKDQPNPTIALTIAIGQRLAAAVANDAGAGHILAAADAPLVSLFGPTPAAKFAPSAKRGEIIEAQAYGAAEMNAIPVDTVAEAVERLID